jgi:hypothetical protein
VKAIVPSLTVLLVGLSAGGPARGQGDFPLTWSEARETDPIAAVGRFSRKALAQRSVAFKAVPKGLSDKALYFAIPMGSRTWGRWSSGPAIPNGLPSNSSSD